MRRLTLALVVVLVALAAAGAAGRAASAPTVVTIQFDDGTADQYGALAILGAHGMHATFYVNTGVIEAFAVNRGKDNGPASKLGTGGLERPVAARFDNTGGALYVVDFGVLTMEEGKPKPRENTGVLWRITREGTGTASAAEGSR